MKYYTVTAENADGTPNTLNFDRVSEMSLTSMRGFFAENGVVLKETYAYSIDDRPIYFWDDDTNSYLPNTGQVV